MLRILVCDDDPKDAARLARALEALPDFCADGMPVDCVTAPDAMMETDFSLYDILFLDIDMGGVNGIDLARKARAARSGAVLVFVTNYIEYAPEGYEVNAFRYLAKSELERRLPRYFADALAVCRARRGEVTLPCGGQTVTLAAGSLVYIESVGHDQCLRLAGAAAGALSTRAKMAELEELLAPHGFLRIHKGYLVNMAYVRRLQSTGAELTTGERLPVGARRYREAKGRFLDWTVRQP